MNSLEIREIKMKLIDMVNGIPLPLEVKRMMLQEVLNELNAATEQEINLLITERKPEEAAQKASEIAEKAQGYVCNSGENAIPGETK